MSFESFLNTLKTKTSELKTEALKFKNKDFLNATMAGSALIAMADGLISPEEKQKMIKFIEHHDALSVFTTTDVITAFQTHVNQLQFDKDVGEAKAFEALKKIASNVPAARLTLRMVISIAASDGDFDTHEKKMALRIAKELALDPAEFELT
ncbi:MAG: tellurite resistance TerB family protein [Methylomonas sp.]|nr:tellurite resistance TerB family protein [Methylomonas sp.]PPD22061.1 MAG: Tellurite resistance TerB [Methylomonas sp.]PPD23579.1 MAG: Tellurite resistance TerB [Methylomonas sp.]PPD42451.1 MAG: Tellurite resistance TerB [Methylomonas sp.]PPD53869.1 MAG: Tellurite resistance TerB [Methylomonas sp.]